MAIGLGLLFGLTLPANFNAPYHATSLKDFWRRWHMTLSRFLRDYVYIPLGGSRQGFGRYLVATLITMALCGLWHGAAWTFVAWGVMHGAGLVVCTLWERYGRSMPAPAGWALTMLFVLVGWVLFRAADFAAAGTMLAAMAGFGNAAGYDPPRLAVMGIAALLAVTGPPSLDFVQRQLPRWRAAAVVFASLAVLCVLEVGQGQPVTFIYFQFRAG